MRSPPSPKFLAAIPRDFARAHLLLSQGRDDGRERLVVADRTPPAAVHNTAVRLGIEVEASIADGEAIARWVDEAYGREPEREAAGETVAAPAESIEALLDAADRDLLATQGKGPVIRLVDALLFEALSRKGSDIHIQPLEDRTLIRYRVDGSLHTVREVSRSLTAALTSRVKVMGRMDIAEKRLGQDGRASVRIGDRSIDLRISTFPTSHGERTVLRLLDPATQPCDFEALGMPPEIARRFLAGCERADGFVLVTGPTGSGKTTTLYSTLRRVATPDLNVMTIEDPIEYQLSTAGLAVSQAQVNAVKGVTFESGLRHILRQDPDVILVGEIRDAPTARMAIQSSLTGHLVFSTLHTNDAPSAITRLLDLGVERFLLASSLFAVLAQRLVRRLHRVCEGGGCAECFGTGFQGRVGIFELLVVDEEIERRIASGDDVASIRSGARRAGMRSLREEGERLVAAGVTTAVEVARVVGVVA